MERNIAILSLDFISKTVYDITSDMERTISIKIGTQHDAEFEELGRVFVSAMNDIVDIAWASRTFSFPAIHALCYYKIREKYGLKSNHICAAERIVYGSLASGKAQAKKKKKTQTKPHFTQHTIGYDIRTSKITSTHLSLATLNNRVHIDIKLSEYQSRFFDGTWKIGSSKLTKRNDGNWYLNVSVSKAPPPQKTYGKTIGIDQGIRHIAVTSDGKFINSGRLNFRTSRMRKLRGELSSKGTPSSRKRLKLLARRENRFREDVLHCSVKSILSGCEEVKCIVLEDLKKIEKNYGRSINRRVSNWGFSKFRKILEYKAEEYGIAITTVDPRYTSQKCSQCSTVNKSSRKISLHLYSCTCGLQLNDDLNAARNIRANHLLSNGETDRLSVNQPNVTPSGCDKPPHL